MSGPALKHSDPGWAFHHCMTQAERDAFDRYLVESNNPLAFVASTQEYRFKAYWKGQNNEYDTIKAFAMERAELALTVAKGE